MKNRDIITLGNAGFLAATGHSLPVEHFYKFVKFKRALWKAYASVSDMQTAFAKEAGLDVKDLVPGGKPDAEALAKYNALNAQMIAEDCQMPAVRIPMDCYKGFYDENRAVMLGGRPVDLFANIEVEGLILENLFSEDENNE